MKSTNRCTFRDGYYTSVHLVLIFRDEKVKVLKAVEELVLDDVVLGQYQVELSFHFCHIMFIFYRGTFNVIRNISFFVSRTGYFPVSGMNDLVNLLIQFCHIMLIFYRGTFNVILTFHKRLLPLVIFEFGQYQLNLLIHFPHI